MARLSLPLWQAHLTAGLRDVKRTGIRAKLVRAFAIQVTIISLVTLGGIFIAYNIIFGVVMRQALNAEAEHFWSHYEADARHPLPDVYNLQGYMAMAGDMASVPEEYRGLAPVGFTRLELGDQQALLHVSERDGNRLFLIFEYEQVSDLAFFFGIVPLSLVLLLIYGMSFLTYRLSQQAVSPIVRLSKYFEDFDFSAERQITLDLSPLKSGADAEVMSMVEAMEQFTARLNAFIERERVFTQDAGHELRTPVAVFKGSLDLLEQEQDRPAFELKALRRMRRTVADMESLLETLLMLAREDDIAAPKDPVRVNDVVANQLDMLQATAAKANNTLALHERAELNVAAPEKVIEIVIGNLIRNAINYTDAGSVNVFVTDRAVRVEDSGVGMTGEQLENAFEPFYRADESRGAKVGHGLGLSIVKRLVHRWGWSISVHSSPGKGTTVEVQFAGG
jgi:signal transduction histidine kinase